ncbi:MAG: Protein kinase domain [Clostridia bacterium]|jgi:serine/threonine protein kinase|nr:Protein kinase domain [Clostridia bacterium]
MLEIGLIDDYLDNMYFELTQGFESNIFVSECDTLTKLFKFYMPERIILRKERILIALEFSKISEKFKIIPTVFQLLYRKDGQFTGYLMESVPGKKLNEFCGDISLADTLFLFKNLQSTLKIIHDNGFCLTDFNPENILISQKAAMIRLVDIDSFCLMGDSTKNIFCNYKYFCPYSKTIDIKYNIYSFYCLFIDILFKVNKKDNRKKEIIKKITDEHLLPESIKEKLLYFVNIRSKKGLLKLEYLF